MLFRAQQGITIAFLEEVWAKNLINFFGSPLTPGEFVLATMVTSVVNVIGAFALQTVAWWNPPTHVFEGMRFLLLDGTNPMRNLVWATG